VGADTNQGNRAPDAEDGTVIDVRLLAKAIIETATFTTIDNQDGTYKHSFTFATDPPIAGSVTTRERSLTPQILQSIGQRLSELIK